MDRTKKIYAYINSNEYIPLNLAELMVVLEVPKDAEGDFIDILNNLCLDGKIYKTKNGRYVSTDSEKSTVVGILQCVANSFFGFVSCGGENADDIFIAGKDMSDALHGDKVIVSVNSNDKSKGHREGRIIGIVERGNKTAVGVIQKEKGNYLHIKPDNNRLYAGIKTTKFDDTKIGDRVVVRITDFKDSKIIGEIVSNLGDSNSIKSCIDGLILSNNVKQTFDEATLSAASQIPDTVSDEIGSGREDLRKLLTFTIDGDDARDFDDAISLTKCNNGNFKLGVHIADVSEYVKEGSPLDSEAYERATSIYLSDRVIPMLPQSLSNGICSLNPNVDRLTLSVFMEIDTQGNILSHKLCKSVICSKERLTYDNVNKLLAGDKELLNKYKNLFPTLKQMEKLSQILNKKRTERGAIQFDFAESQIIVNELGEPIDIKRAERGVSNKMIEEFMLSANEIIAEYAFWAEIPFIYRNHESPTVEKLTAFNKFISHFGLSLTERIDKGEPIHPKSLQLLIDKVKDTPNEQIISLTMLRSLMKAKYADVNLGHFGLAAKYYCHFTSPIRRYPDLVIHRILKDFIDGKLIGDRIEHIAKYVPVAASHSSDCEINAELIERDVDDLMKASYMKMFIGEEFEGVVANVTNFGMFIELDNSVEGLIRVENMTDDYYEYNEEKSTLTGKRKGIVYTTGSRVKIVVARADILSRQIDFVLRKDATKQLLNKIKTKDKPQEIENKKQAKRKHNKRKKRKGKYGKF